MRRARAQGDLDVALSTSLMHFGLEQCLVYSQLMDDAIDEIAVDPIGYRSKLRPEFGATCRSLPIKRRGRPGRHIIFYRLLPDGSVEVQRIFHDSMEARLHGPPVADA